MPTFNKIIIIFSACNKNFLLILYDLEAEILYLHGDTQLQNLLLMKTDFKHLGLSQNVYSIHFRDYTENLQHAEDT